MGNTFITPSLVAKEALMQLDANCVFAGLVHRDYEQEFKKAGDSVTIRKPATFEAKEFSSAIDVQEATEGSTTVVLDHHLDTSFEITSKERTLKLSEFSERLVKPAMEAIAQKIDAIVAGLYVDIPFATAISGTPAMSDFANVRKILNNNKVPLFGRSLVMNPDAEADYITLPQIANAEKSGSTAALREASMGRIYGFDTYMDQNIVTHVIGTLGTAKVDTGIAIGATAATLYNASLTGTLKKGDIVTFASDATQYVITALATAAANEIDITFYPAKKIAAAGDAAVTIVAGGGQNLAFHRNAFALVTRPLELPEGAARASILNYKGFGLRVVMDYDITHKKDIVSIDLLCGAKTLTPEMACRLIG